MNRLSDIAKQALMSPKEALLETGFKESSLCIGIPKETSFQENRIALTPLSVALLVQNGHEVIIESGAGLGANFTDNNYYCKEKDLKLI
jgi:alanine dehydrogenase